MVDDVVPLGLLALWLLLKLCGGISQKLEQIIASSGQIIASSNEVTLDFEATAGNIPEGALIQNSKRLNFALRKGSGFHGWVKMES